MRLPICLGLAASLLTAPALADVYECTTTNFGSGGWIGEKYMLSFDGNPVAGSVYGPIIHAVHNEPISVDVKNPSPIRWEFRYTVVGYEASNAGSTRISYKIVLNAQTGRFLISGRLHGYDNNISGSGTCKRVQ